MAWKIKAALASATGLRALGSLMVLCPLALWFVLPLAGREAFSVLGWAPSYWPKGSAPSGWVDSGEWRQAAFLSGMLCCELVGFWLVAMGFKAKAVMAGWEQKALSHQEAGALESSVPIVGEAKRSSKRL